MATRPRYVAHHVLFALLAAALIALGVRLFVFQRNCHAEMVAKAESQQRMRIDIPARRGDIYANSHATPVLLATSHQAPSCFADPGIIRDDELEKVAREVSQAVGKSFVDVYGRLIERREARFVWLARNLDEATARRITELRLPGVGIRGEWRRNYPAGSLAAHVIGFSGTEGRGLEGIELFADQYLRAADGHRVLRVDAARRPIWNDMDEYVPQRDGFDVHLTLDVIIQEHVEKVLQGLVEKYRAESAVGIVVDPRTGDVLAMANVPTYDLAAFGSFPPEARRNRAVTDVYEPGSIFKPFIAAAALERRVARMGEMFYCHGGAYRCKSGRLLHDAYGYGNMSFEAGVYKSINTLMAQLGERMGNDALYETVTAFGFGRPAGIEIGGESPGLVNAPRNWTSYSTTSIPMGQEIGVTGLQMTMAFAALANDGVLLRPRLVRAVYDEHGRKVVDNAAPSPVRQAMSAESSRRMVREVLALVPTVGTARNLGNLNGWSSFGKTGTAQIALENGRGYEPNAYTASYIAGAPVMNPRLICLVSVHKPNRSIGHYGGTVAGPAVKNVLEKALAYLEVPKDDTGARRDSGPTDARE